MKIIKEGNIKKQLKIKQFSCSNCDCIFEATKDEYKTHMQYNEQDYTCECPTCKYNVPYKP